MRTNLISPRTGYEAVLSGQTQSVTTLIQAGADIDAQEDDGRTALSVLSRHPRFGGEIGRIGGG